MKLGRKKAQANISAAFPAYSDTAAHQPAVCSSVCEEMAEDRWHVILSFPLPVRALRCSLDSRVFNKQHSPEKFLETSMVVKMAPCGGKRHLNSSQCKVTLNYKLSCYEMMKSHQAYVNTLVFQFGTKKKHVLGYLLLCLFTYVAIF